MFSRFPAGNDPDLLDQIEQDARDAAADSPPFFPKKGGLLNLL
jgi:hypothetical protein